ncbi:cation diffusion facilitator family transporter [Crenobacter sp. SG2303]|uniref:Cation diffusion facilitator family transporter n=1 Tax=Crenobacter oryzisoli TaxID=3056844 RepID=A0ABT7XL98_9NEIS|nr:cation diffusion facilitator family transporter [Crenobacter sp. SG2303]MDN0074566.1 cation diffusion facilitator family transporter [Crenobacter sp. SG2303]
MNAAEMFDESDDNLDRQQAARRSTWVSVVVNLLLTLLQVAAGLISGSQGLVADGIHSLSDLMADFVVLLASHHSRKEPDADHHYGHHRYENAASLVLGVLLLVVGIGMLGNAISKIEQPSSQPVQLAALWVALGALLAKELLFRYMLAIAKRVRSSMLIANAWHARSDAASSLIVAVGIVGNLLGYHLLDPVAALVVGLMVTKMGWSFAWDALHDLMDRSADEESVAAIHTALIGTPGVMGVHDLKTRKVGDLILVDVHLEVDADRSVEQGHDIALEARRRAMEDRTVLNVMTHVDPYRA